MTEYEMHEGGLEILNQELMAKLSALQVTISELRTCLYKGEKDNISYLMTEFSCEADNIYKAYIVGPNGA